jgi:hypothetical protein
MGGRPAAGPENNHLATSHPKQNYFLGRDFVAADKILIHRKTGVYCGTRNLEEIMKKFVLIVVLLAAVFYLASQRYAVKSAKQTDGTYSVVVVDKSSGKIWRLMGK